VGVCGECLAESRNRRTGWTLFQCFCGCGRSIRLRRWSTNKLGATFSRAVAMAIGAVERMHQFASDEDLRKLASSGPELVSHLAAWVHEEHREEWRGSELQSWYRHWNRHHDDIVTVADGWSGGVVQAAHLVLTGTLAPGMITFMRDTHASINDDPVVETRIRVYSEGLESFTLARKTTVSRLCVPSVGERVEVAFDPLEPRRFTFRPGRAAGNQS
jgi:hypothetical protein